MADFVSLVLLTNIAITCLLCIFGFDMRNFYCSTYSSFISVILFLVFPIDSCFINFIIRFIKSGFNISQNGLQKYIQIWCVLWSCPNLCSKVLLCLHTLVLHNCTNTHTSLSRMDKPRFTDFFIFVLALIVSKFSGNYFDVW